MNKGCGDVMCNKEYAKYSNRVNDRAIIVDYGMSKFLVYIGNIQGYVTVTDSTFDWYNRKNTAQHGLGADT